MQGGTKEYYAEYYQKNKEKHNATMKKWQQEKNYSTASSVKKWQEKNADKVKEYNRLNKREQTKKRRAFINEYKSKCTCKKCGDARPYVLDFHHIDPTQKSFDLGDASTKSINVLKIELEKCITLCRNCHSEFHYLEKQHSINIDTYLT